MALKLKSAGNGSVTLDVPNTASDYTLTVPNRTATVLADDGSGKVRKADLPSGSVLQVVVSNVTANFNTTSSSYVHASNHSLSITTSSNNSKILLFCNTPIQMAAGNTEAQSTFRSSLDSYVANLGETIQANYSDGNGGWKQITQLQYLHNPLQSSGTAITYRIYLRRKNGTDTIYFPDPWGATYSYSIIAMEIAA
jgi:hypothetical protein